MSDPVRIEPERLLAQTAWVRRLALSLSRDESSADDLAQEALAMALRKPPSAAQSEGALRAWFAAVTRNLAIHRARGDSRRDRREREVARPELERSQDRLRELEELRSELVKHVLTLPELSQQVVLLHFFEELDSAEIARRLGVPDSTIRNRLRRALVELREKIERKHGSDWRNLCLFALPGTGAKLATGSGAAVAAAGGLWIGGGAALLLALALLFTWQLRRPEKPDSTDTALLAALPAAVESKPDAPAPSERSSPASERAPEPIVANTKPFLLFGRVLDVQKKPVKSARISLTDDRNENFSSQDSPEGWYSFTALAPALYDARIEADGGAPLVLQLDLRTASGDTRRDFTLGEMSYVQVRLLRSDGTPWQMNSPAHSIEREHELCVVATLESPGKLLAHPTWGDYSNFGVGRYRSPARNGSSVSHQLAGSSGVLEVFGPRPVFASLCQGARVLETKLVDAGTDSIEFVLAESFVDGLASSATGIVIDERSGAPIAGIGVSLSPYWRSGTSSTSDEQGKVEFQGLATGTLQLALGGQWGGLGGISRSIEILPGKPHDLGTLPWLPQRTLRAHVVDTEGNPVAARIGLTLDDTGLDPAWSAPNMSGESDAAGHFEWANSPGFDTTIVATSKGPTPRAGAATIARGDERTAEIRMLPARIVGLHADIPLGPYSRILVRDSHGTTWAEAGSRWSLMLPDGEYRATAWVEGRKLGERAFRVDAGTRAVDLRY